MNRVHVLLCIAAAVGLTAPVRGDTFSLYSGTTGTTTIPQSFNETRGVDVTVLSASGWTVNSMVLGGLSISTPAAMVGARIYDSSSMVLLASAQTTISSGANQIVSLPITATLASGGSYRMSFFVFAGGAGGSATMFDPNPPSSGGFPYTELNGVLRINQAYSISTDTFPSNANIFVPLITIVAAAVQPPGVGFCFGDDSGTHCPCTTTGGAGVVPPGMPGRGCPNSVFPGGAQLSASGVASIAADTLHLLGSSMPNSSALYFQANSQAFTGATAGVIFGDGLRCITTSVVRLATETNVANASAYPQPGNPSVSAKGGVTAPGTRYYQVWYRNPAAFCTASTFNLSNALNVTWGT